MRTTIALLSLGLLASGGHAQSNVNTRVEWDPTLMEGKANTEWVTEDGDERALKVTPTNPGNRQSFDSRRSPPRRSNRSTTASPDVSVIPVFPGRVFLR